MISRTALALCVVAAVLASHAAAASIVTLRVFSGTPNPSWQLSEAQEIKLRKMVATHTFSGVQTHIMGYTGFEFDGSILFGSPAIESFLLHTAAPGLLSASVLAHVRDRIFAKPSAAAHVFGPGAESSNVSADCNHVVGPNTAPVYDPTTDDRGCFIQEIGNNNCYNYANDIVTNTFAQPGRGTGHKWVTDDCASVTTGAKSDGLVWAGTTLPTKQPAQGHYVAMLIWPDTNFHWIRMDADLYWSHKPGGTAVRNVDDNGNKITDPSKSNFSPWTQFCGYFSTVPSNVTID